MLAVHSHKPTKPTASETAGHAKPGKEGGGSVPVNPLWLQLATHTPIQAKLAVSQPNDPYEQEADRVADRVLRMPTQALQRACATCAAGGSPCPTCEDKSRGLVQRKVQSHADSSLPSVSDNFVNNLGVGRPLDTSTRLFMESRFGQDFGRVRVHTGTRAADSARAVHALAYTVGRSIVFSPEHFAPGTLAGNRLLAHELTHVLQQRAAGPSLQRSPDDDQEPPHMSVSGDTERKSPAGGIAIANGSLEWKLRYVGKDTKVTPGTGMQFNMVLGTDVIFEASFTPTPSGSTCPTITFSQIVQPTIDGLWDTGSLLYTRSPVSGASADVKHDASAPETEPFYGADPSASGPGLKAAPNLKVAGTAAGASATATHADAPYQRVVAKGKTAERKFETAVICVQTAETFGSIRWGYTKTGAGVVTLTSATAKDVQATSASTDFESTRQAFYSGFFQLSLGDFATGSAVLPAAHKTTLDAIDVKDLTRVILVGANDNSGGAEAKAALSLKRAETVRDYLVKTRGVSASLIKVEGHGVEARVPNPPGKDVPANRRVDVHLQRGAETIKPVNARLGSAAERKRLLKQNPRKTVNEAVDTIIRLDATTGRVSTAEWSELSDMLSALDLWRSVDPTVPDLRRLYTAALKRLEQRAQVYSAPIRPPLPQLGPISPEVDEALRKYEESKKRLEDLKRERDEALRRLDEEAGPLEDQ